MKCNTQKMKYLREHIPTFECLPGCHDCCGPVTASTEEMARLPVKSEAEHEAALTAWSCPHLGCDGCQVYDERPLICRLFGTTKSLPCPHGQRPETMVDSRIEKAVHSYLRQTRQVLV